MLKYLKLLFVFIIGVGANIPALFAADYFSDPAYVTLRESNQNAYFPGAVIWKGGPKMLYNSISPDGKTLVVSSPKESSIYIYDAKNGNQLGKVACDKESKGLNISPDGKEVYVSNEGAATLSVVNLASMKVEATIPTDKMPHNVRFTKNGKIVYVTLQGGAGLGVIDTSLRKVIKVIKTPGIEAPHNLDLSNDDKFAYIRDLTNKVGVLDLESEKIIKIIEVGQGHAGIDVMPNGKYIATGAIADDIVTIIDAKSLQVIKKIKVGFGPHGVRASKDSRWLYVAVTADNKFVVIDTNKLEIVKEFPASDFPFWVAVNGNS